MQNMQKMPTNAKKCKSKNKDPMCKICKKYAKIMICKIFSLCRVYIFAHTIVYAKFAPGTLLMESGGIAAAAAAVAASPGRLGAWPAAGSPPPVGPGQVRRQLERRSTGAMTVTRLITV